MIIDILLFLVGIALIVLGANFLTDGAAAFARRLGLSPLMVGLTIVAFGTSAPELVVSITSALSGSSDMALGNVVGSNIFNILVIGGITSMVAPLSISQSTIKAEIPMMILACVVAVALVLDAPFSGLMNQINVVSRTDGFILLAFFAIFLAYTISISKRPEDIGMIEEVEQHALQEKKKKPIWVLFVMMIGGLIGLVFGGDLFVKSASNLAKALGVSEAIIGLTVVAAGTSLPELATSIVAALKGEQEMAIGNVVGSSIFNIFFILGTTAVIKPIGMGELNVMDFLTMVVASLLLYLFGVFFGNRSITRLEGAFLSLAYVAYTAYLISQL